MTTTVDHRSHWDAYGELWRTTDTTEQTTAAEATLASDCTYTDPNAHAAGIGEIVDYMNVFQQSMPGGHFITTSFVEHHDRALASWNMATGDGTVVGTGTSFVRFAEDGAITSLTGFFETPADA